MCYLNINLGILADSVLVVGGVAGAGHAVLVLLLSLRVRVLDILPDGDAGAIPQFLEVLLELISCFLEFAARAFVREHEEVFDEVDSAQDICRHFKII